MKNDLPIGMDHFALKRTVYTILSNGCIVISWGTVPQKTQLMIGLGVSSISDS
jgi:oxygen-independent coproporphyrinogen-3 oxidase